MRVNHEFQITNVFRFSLFILHFALCTLPCTSPALALEPSYSVTDTHNRHNLSVTGPGIIGITKDSNQKGVCIFCHTPHHATSVTPLWSRKLNDDPESYTPYTSKTLNPAAKPGQPLGASRLCLSCHDGTVALGMLAGDRQIASLPRLPASRPSNLSTDLSDDHPISFSYFIAGTTSNNLKNPQSLSPAIKLENGNMECTACHDPHRDRYPPADDPLKSGMFLVMDNNKKSALCVECHIRAGLIDGAHYTSLSGDVCGKCHAQHNAQQPQQLLRGNRPQDTCLLNCHNKDNSVSTTGENIAAMKPQGWDVHRTGTSVLSGKHDAGENPQDFTALNTHVECVDCHNPCLARHENSPLSNPPYVNGRLTEVTLERRADGTRIMATREYEICFKCHGDHAFVPAAILRQVPFGGTGNESDRFNTDNPAKPSYHPVMAPVPSSSIPADSSKMSLRKVIVGTGRIMGKDSMIYCSDCHNSHGALDPIRHLLVDQYPDTTPQPYTTEKYMLCYRCHDNEVLMNPSLSTFPKHKSHVVDRGLPCFVCHDPHGIPAAQGGTPNGNAHLINFYTNGITGSYDASLKSCTVNCHTTGSPNPQTHPY